jgi:peptide/nickel transport system permease protein
MRYTRASMLDVLNSDYVTTARSKGLVNRTVVMRHAFRNSLIPIITVIGLLLPELVGGAVITEQIFAWPGMGQMAVRAASDRDTALMMGVVLVVGTAVIITNILVDLLYAVVDPRIRFGHRTG